MKSKFALLIVFLVAACVEPYDFKVKNDTPVLVIEALISDKSFNESLGFPSDGRYFSVKLSSTSDVINVRSEPVQGASITLFDDQNNYWIYSESFAEKGIYHLVDNEFKALPEREYKLVIVTGEKFYESEWEQLPEVETPPIGNVSFVETIEQRYVIEAKQPVVRPIKSIKARITVNENPSGEEIFYRWKFSPMWIYKAPLSRGNTSPGYICWATDQNYLKSYGLQIDRSGGYTKDLFTIPTIRNERIFEDFSVLITQYALNEGNYQFYKDIQIQNEGSAMIDIPPYNAATNFSSENGEKVVGYFGVVKEQSIRWYFSKEELSYTVENTLKADCLVNYGPPLPDDCPIPGPSACECKYCLDYSFGETTDIKPSWWRDR